MRISEAFGQITIRRTQLIYKEEFVYAVSIFVKLLIKFPECISGILLRRKI